jgi:CBS domain-containing protein
MYVHSVLKIKAQTRQGAVTVTALETATLLEATQKLATHKIGAVVITSPDGRVAGILSERDIVRVLAQSGPDALSATVGDVMTRAVITCTADDTIKTLMAKMTRGRFRHVPVVDGQGLLTGVVSIGDVVKFHVEEIEHEASALRDYITQPH